MLSGTRPSFGAVLLCTTSALALSTAAYGQDANNQNSNSGAETVVVTGSRVIADAANSPTPLTIVTTNQLLATTPTQISQGLNKLPEFVGSGGSHEEANAGAEDGASDVVNLRGFGAQRTLVLLDGQRLPASNADGTVNIDTLPQMLVQRVDVVTGGASAVYGSDAVTGVVNFVLDNHFTGMKFDVNAGISTYEDAASYNAGVAVGADILDGRGHVEGELHAYHQDPVFNFQRPISNMIWGQVGTGTAANPYTVQDNLTETALSFGGKITCSGCAANGQQFVSNGQLGPFYAGTPSGLAGIDVGGDGAYGSLHTFNSLTSNENSFGRLSYNINDDTTFYVQAGASQLYSKSAFNNVYLQTGTAANEYFSNNAYLTPQATAALANGSNNMFELTEFVNNHLGDWDGQITEYTENNYLVNAGLEGTLFDKYGWSAYYTHGFDRLEIGSPHNLSIQRQWAANDAVAGPGGTVECYVSTTTYAPLYPGCVPINPFGPSSLTAQQYNYLVSKTYAIESKNQDNIGGSISGDVIDDWAGPVKAALSSEARWYNFGVASNGLNSNVNCAGLRLCNTQSVLWQGATLPPMPTVSENVWEVAGEVGIPLLKDAPLVQDLSLDIAGRYTDYSVTGSVETWKLGFDYHVNDEVRFRGTTSIDIRAPTLYDLFSPPTVVHTGVADIHTNVAAITGIESAGNPNLLPEVSRTYTGGIVYTPEFVPNLTFSVDYYNIDMKNAISSLSGNSTPIENLCEAANGTGPFCALYVRPLPFSDRTPANYPTLVYSLSLNSAFQRTEGWDLELNYGFQMSDVWADTPGAVSLRMVANIVPVLESQAYPGGPIQYAAANEPYSNVSTEPSSKGRVTSYVSYSVGTWGFNLQDRWLSGYPHTLLATDVFAAANLHVNSVNYQDVTIDKKFLVDDRTLDGYFSIQNIGNVLPPINLADGGSSPGTWYQGANGGGAVTNYDLIGRYFTIGVRATL